MNTLKAMWGEIRSLHARLFFSTIAVISIDIIAIFLNQYETGRQINIFLSLTFALTSFLVSTWPNVMIAVLLSEVFKSPTVNDHMFKKYFSIVSKITFYECGILLALGVLPMKINFLPMMLVAIVLVVLSSKVTIAKKLIQLLSFGVIIVCSLLMIPESRWEMHIGSYPFRFFTSTPDKILARETTLLAKQKEIDERTELMRVINYKVANNLSLTEDEKKFWQQTDAAAGSSSITSLIDTATEATSKLASNLLSAKSDLVNEVEVVDIGTKTSYLDAGQEKTIVVKKR